jgi:hypothetical protein
MGAGFNLKFERGPLQAMSPRVMTYAILATVIFELAVTFYAVIRAALKRLENFWQE